MSLPLLHEVAAETRRLAIAGSSLAPGDFRLRKLVDSLERAGAKSPVFAKVAAAVKNVVEGDEKSSATALLDLSTLVNAIRYTQGETGAEGDLSEIVPANAGALPATTATSYRVLAPVIEALTSTGSGRFEIVRDAHERGALKDLRLLRHAVATLGDHYGELADYVAKEVLPGFGPAVYPLLAADLDPKGGRLHARRIEVMSRIDREAARNHCRAIFDDTTKEVRIAAIRALAGSAQDAPLLIEQTKAKGNDIRRAAYRALGGIATQSVVDLFRQVIKSKDIGLASDGLSQIASGEVAAEIVAEVDRAAGAIAKRKEVSEEELSAFLEALACLHGRREPGVESCLLRCFREREKFGKGKQLGREIQCRLAWHLLEHGSPAALAELVRNADNLDRLGFGYAFAAAQRSLPPKEVLKKFSKYLADRESATKNAPSRSDAVSVVIRGNFFADWADRQFVSSEEFPGAAPEWDPGWIDAAIKAGRSDVVMALAPAGHRKAGRYLTKALANADDHEISPIIEALIRIEPPGLVKTFLGALRKALEKTGYQWWTSQVINLIGRLPASAYPELQKFANTLDENQVDRILVDLNHLKNKTPTS